VSRCRLAHMAALALVLAAVGAPGAAACNDPKIAADTTSVHPGDTVSFSIDNLEPGATWTVELEGQTLASGDASASEHRTFTVPDLGDSAGAMNVKAIITHADIADGSVPIYWPVQYSKPSATPAPPAASSTATPSTQPAAGIPAKQSTAKPATGAKPATKPTAPKPRHNPSAQRTRHRENRDTVARPRPAQKAVHAVAPAVTARPQAVPAPAAAHVVAPPRARHKHRPAATGSRAAPVGAATRLRRLAADLPRAPVPLAAGKTAAAAASERSPAIPIVVGLAAAALLALVLAVLLRRRRDGTGLPQPVPDDAPRSPERLSMPLTDEERRMLAIEAELQEIVAEGSRTVARSP